MEERLSAAKKIEERRGLLTKEQAELTDLAQEIKAEHAKCRESLRAGELLIKAKSLCAHGEWGKWLEEHCNFSERIAQTYMRVSRGFPLLESKAKRVADLSLRKAVQLLATSSDSEEERAALARAPQAQEPKAD